MRKKGNLLTVIKPMLFFTFPIYFLTFGIREDRIVVSKPKTASAVFSAIICSVYKYMRIPRNSLVSYEQFVVSFTSYLFVVFCVVSHVNCLVNAKCIVKIWNEILVFADVITEEAFFKRTFRTTCLQVMAYNGLFVAYIVSYYYFYSEDFQNVEFVLEAIVDYFILMHFCGIVVVFSNGLLFGCKVISTVNKELERLKQIEWHKNNQRWNGLSFPNASKIKELRSHMRVVRHEDLSTSLDVYDRLCKSFEELNERFGISLTVSSLNNFMEMTLSCYFMIKHGMKAVKLFSLWLIYCFFIELTLLYACEKFMKETKKTGTILNVLVTENSSQVLKESVQRFSMHLLHRRVKFTACRLFELNYQLLFSVASGIVTYLVIVIQFDKS